MPRKPATEEQKAKIRSGIRAAALALYREEGLTNITARSVAVRAGVSVGTIYAYFGSLSELMQSLWRKPVEKFEARLTKLAEVEASPEVRARTLLMEYQRFALKNPELYRGSFMFVRPTSIASPPKQPLETSVFMQLLVDAIKEGQREGTFRQGEPELLAQVLWAGLHGAIALPLNIDRFSWARKDVLETAMLDTLLRDLLVS